jgi:hypothetical protein
MELVTTAPDPFTLRAPCRVCESLVGYLAPSGGQDCAFCQECRTFQYNAPRTEPGRAIRTVSAVHSLVSKKRRYRILVRATGRCELCGAPPSAENPIHVDHVISVKDGCELGLTTQEINDDFNLLALCEACNSAKSTEPMPPRLILALFHTFLAARRQGMLRGD